MKKFFYLILITAITVISENIAFAGIVITGTRIIYPSDAREVSVKITNKGKRPVLIQSWIDDGDTEATPDKISVPFVLTPPINRVEPEKGQTLRISYTGANLPADRETVYWLNVLEIPAKNPLLKDKNLLQMAFRTRIKLFFRPTSLKDDANEAINALTWRQAGQQVIANNPTPYHVSLIKIDINGKEKSVDMVMPFSEKAFNIAGKPGAKITGSYVNDYGSVREFESQIR
ncbi:molecular chaperone [Kalamiella sp. sgz302252]|uniref:fimbrial biogenesis chaperone n=1 Tax=Pantoea sp. sgz302252 TaxID=3341827 RepID=UPI0036D26E0D